MMTWLKRIWSLYQTSRSNQQINIKKPPSWNQLEEKLNMSKQILGAKLQHFKILHCVFLTLWFFSIGPGPTGTVRVAGRWWWCKSRNGGFDPPFFLQRYFIVQFETLRSSSRRHRLLNSNESVFYETFFNIHQLFSINKPRNKTNTSWHSWYI